MCGIIGYVGKKPATPILLEGLHRLEYRGYDSSGMVVLNHQGVNLIKSVGDISSLEERLEGRRLEGSCGIAHTRWATHGAPSEVNTHPHMDCKDEIYLVHNGIIENYRELKENLIKEGHRFRSETDTEVLAHLIERYYNGNLEEATRQALFRVRGTYGLAVISRREPNKIVAARHGSPLLIGVGENENLIASDAAAVMRYTHEVIYLEEGEIATLGLCGIEITNIERELIHREAQRLEWDLEEVQKGGFPHFMLKEIFEQPEVVENSIRGRLILEEGLAKLGGLERVYDHLGKIERIIIVSCGTAFYAGLVQEYMLEEYAGIPTEVELASEFRYRKPIIHRDETAVLAISQSGETADTISAIREAKRKGALTLGVVNVVGSTIARETDAGVYNHAGPEIGVASTKAFVSQLAISALLTLMLGRQREMSMVTGQRVVSSIKNLPEQIREILKQNESIKEIANRFSHYNDFLYLGRKYNYPIALEGALKLKEISYIHAEGYAAGEMKHGPLALIDENFPVVAIVPKDSVYLKVRSNLEEIKARGGKVIAVATEGDQEIASLADEVIYIPKTLEVLTPILAVVPLQLLAYHIGVARGRNVDKPRNLAKSVTVE